MSRFRRERVWTKDRLKYLNENYSKKNAKAVADALGVSLNAVRVKASEMGLKSKQTVDGKTFWDAEKIDYLMKHYATDSDKSIAVVIGCSDTAIRNKAKKLSLNKNHKGYNTSKCEYGKNSTRKQCHYGRARDIGKNKSEVTDATRTLVCACELDNMTIHQTALLTSRTDAQIKQILEECKASGYYAWIKSRRKTGAIKTMGA